MKSFIDIPALREAYREGRNVIQAVNAMSGASCNSAGAIEIAYDLQAGQYIRNHAGNPGFYDAYTDEQAALLRAYFPDCESLLDAGCGELTNTALVVSKLPGIPAVFGFDISWSRLHVGLAHYRARLGETLAGRTRAFAAEMAAIPLPDDSIDVVTTSHALEPNHGREAELLGELLRVSRRGLLLLEPSWELGDDAQRENMARHGYVRGLPGHCERLGARIEAHRLMEVRHNPLNRTAVTVVRKTAAGPAVAPVLVDPQSRTPLVFDVEDRVYHSPARGVVYPVLRGIPVLKEGAAVLATGFEARPAD